MKKVISIYTDEQTIKHIDKMSELLDKSRGDIVTILLNFFLEVSKDIADGKLVECSNNSDNNNFDTDSN